MGAKRASVSRVPTAKQLAALKPFQKGQSGNPGGRKPGSKNKRTKEHDALLEDLKVNNMMPLDFLILELNNPKNSLAIRFKCAAEALPYCHRRMPIGVDDGRGGPLKSFSFTPADLLDLSEEDLVKLIVRLESVSAHEADDDSPIA